MGQCYSASVCQCQCVPVPAPAPPGAEQSPLPIADSLIPPCPRGDPSPGCCSCWKSREGPTTRGCCSSPAPEPGTGAFPGLFMDIPSLFHGNPPGLARGRCSRWGLRGSELAQLGNSSSLPNTKILRDPGAGDRRWPCPPPAGDRRYPCPPPAHQLASLALTGRHWSCSPSLEQLRAGTGTCPSFIPNLV